MPRRRSSHDLRCFCRTEPLLAVYGLDDKGRLYIHVKIYKQARVYGEILATDGEVKIRCRECLRWHRVTIVKPNTAKLEVTDDPLEASDNRPVAMLDASSPSP